LEHPELEKLRVLVVDDMPTMRRIVKNQLRQMGFSQNHIEEAENGAKALLRVQALPQIDFIVSDWNMPEMTGIELLKSVRALPGLEKLPFLMVTAEAKQENVVEAIKARVSNYIVKPFSATALEEKILKILSLTNGKKI